MGIICESCGRDIDALGQDNMGVGAPLCEDCWSGQKRLAVQDRSLQNLHRENERLRSENKALAANLAEMGRRLDEARRERRSDGPASCKRLRRCEPRGTAAPTLQGAASPADAPCLKGVKVEVRPEALAEQVTRSLLDGAAPVMRMGVE